MPDERPRIYVDDATGITFSGVYRGSMTDLHGMTLPAPGDPSEVDEAPEDIFAALAHPDEAEAHGYEVVHLHGGDDA